MKKEQSKTKQFSIRWPVKAVDWIDRQRKQTHRTRAAEFIHQILTLSERPEK